MSQSGSEIYNDWIFYATTYHYFKCVYVKEFCAISLALRKSLVKYVACPILAVTYEIEVEVYKRQFKKHAIPWDYGALSQEGFWQELKSEVSENCEIFTYGKLNTKLFQDAGYKMVSELYGFVPDIKTLTEIVPPITCAITHPRISCACNIVAGLHKATQPALVPYLELGLLAVPPKDDLATIKVVRNQESEDGSLRPIWSLKYLLDDELANCQ